MIGLGALKSRRTMREPVTVTSSMTGPSCAEACVDQRLVPRTLETVVASVLRRGIGNALCATEIPSPCYADPLRAALMSELRADVRNGQQSLFGVTQHAARRAASDVFHCVAKSTRGQLGADT